MSKLKANISSRFGSQDVIADFSIFDPKKVPSIDSADIKTYGESFVDILYSQFGVPRAAKTLDGAECTKEPIVSNETIIEWKNYRRFLAQHPKKTISAQLRELATKGALSTCHNLPNYASNHSISREKFFANEIKSRLRNRLSDISLSHLMKVALESPEHLSDSDLEQIVNIWNRKPRKISV